jgi:hypothetical protein
MKKLILIFLLATDLSVNAQITFYKTFGDSINADYGNSVQPTFDGGYIISGYKNDGDADAYLIKTDANGDTLWTRTYGGVSSDLGNFVQQTADSGYIIVGHTLSFGAGLLDVYLIKTNSIGELLWTKSYGSSGYDMGLYVEQTSDGGYILTGKTKNTSTTNDNAYIIKTDSSGDTLWTKVYGVTDIIDGFCGYQTPDGGYIFCGSIEVFGSSYTDGWLLKTDANGNQLWAKTYGGPDDESFRSVQLTMDGGYIMTGNSYGFGAGDYDVYLVKADSNGSMVWSKTFGNAGNDNSGFVQQTADGGYCISGSSWSFNTGNNFQSYIIKTDANGDTLWTRIFGGVYDAATSIHQTSDSGYIITGVTSYGAGMEDVFLVKTDANGNKGCSDQSTATMVTSPSTQESNYTFQLSSQASTVTSPNTITGSGGIVSTICSSVGISEIISENIFVISPNPTSAECMVRSEKLKIDGIEVYNAVGKRFSPKISVYNEVWTIDCKSLSPGIYFVIAETGIGRSAQKLVVE